MSNTDANPRNTVYVGCRSSDGTPHVYADGKTLTAEASAAIRNHSPDGFEWGYCGSGPAQLALALLLHATHGNAEAAELHYQNYKWQVVAGFKKRGFVTTRAIILQWLAAEASAQAAADPGRKGEE